MAVAAAVGKIESVEVTYSAGTPAMRLQQIEGI